VGDGAKVAILELVGYEFKKKEKKEKSKVRKRPWKPRAKQKSSAELFAALTSVPAPY